MALHSSERAPTVAEQAPTPSRSRGSTTSRRTSTARRCRSSSRQPANASVSGSGGRRKTTGFANVDGELEARLRHARARAEREPPVHARLGRRGVLPQRRIPRSRRHRLDSRHRRGEHAPAEHRLQAAAAQRAVELGAQVPAPLAARHVHSRARPAERHLPGPRRLHRLGRRHRRALRQPRAREGHVHPRGRAPRRADERRRTESRRQHLLRRPATRTAISSSSRTSSSPTRSTARHRVIAAYNRRIDRPGEPELRIFPKYDDPELLKVGNPYLRPQLTHVVELGVGRGLERRLDPRVRLSPRHHGRVPRGSSRSTSPIRTTTSSTGSTRTSAARCRPASSWSAEQQVASPWRLSASVNWFVTDIDALQTTLLFPDASGRSRSRRREDDSWDFTSTTASAAARGRAPAEPRVLFRPERSPGPRARALLARPLGVAAAGTTAPSSLFTFTDMFNDFGVRRDVVGDGFTGVVPEPARDAGRDDADEVAVLGARRLTHQRQLPSVVHAERAEIGGGPSKYFA